MSKWSNIASKGALAASICLILTWNSFAGFSEVRERTKVIFKEKEPLGDRSNIALSFVEERLGAGAIVQVYPWPDTPRPGMTDLQGADSSKYALEVRLKHDAWSGTAICLASTADLTPYYDEGALEVWIKGTKGSEIFDVTLLDNGVNSDGHPQRVYMSTRSYTVINNKTWTQLYVPLSDLGGVGSYWSETENKRISNRFNWEGVNCFGIDIEKNRFDSFNVYVDNVRVLKKVPARDNAGVEYPFVNKGY